MSWENAIRRIVDRALRQTYTSMPGIVESYDPVTQKANVKPLIKLSVPGATTADGVTTAQDLTEELPVITDVKIQFPRVTSAAGLDAHIYFPVKVGTLVELCFSTFSLDKWLAGDGINPVDPQDPRHHDISDAFARIGFYPFDTPIPNLDDDDIRIVLDHPGSGKTEVYLGGDTGDFVVLPYRDMRVGDKDATEPAVLGDILKDELDALAQSFVTNAATIVQTGVGPGSLNPTVVTALNTFITNLADILSAKMRLV